MTKYFFYSLAALLAPAAAFAQTPAPGDPGTPAGMTLGLLAEMFLGFLDGTVVRVIFAIAFIVFLWFAFQYFILGGAEEEQRSKGRQFLLWAVIGFFIMFSIWGIVRLVQRSIPLEQGAPTIPCFNQQNCN